MFHKHEWVVLSETTTKSQLEHLKELGYSGKGNDTETLNRKYIMILQCGKCGTLKRFVEDI